MLYFTKTRLYNFDPPPPQTPLLYSKTGVYRDIHYLSYFAKKTSVSKTWLSHVRGEGGGLRVGGGEGGLHMEGGNETPYNHELNSVGYEHMTL